MTNGYSMWKMCRGAVLAISLWAVPPPIFAQTEPAVQIISLRYPALLATTADTNDRVVPRHTFNSVAALQAADLGPMPRLARIETRAGHGAGKPIDKTIAETTDLWAFAAHWTGLQVSEVMGE